MQSNTSQLLADWKESKSIKQAMKVLKLRSKTKTLSKSTVEAYETWIPRFIDFTHLGPDELIAEGLKDSTVAEERIADFYSALLHGKITYAHKINTNSLNTGIYGTLRGFYTKNRVDTHGWSSPQVAQPDVDRTDSDVPLFVVDPKTQKLDLNRDLFVKFLKHLNPRDEGVALCLMSSGLDVSDILGLTIDDITHQADKERIFIMIVRQKTGESAKSFLSTEATRYIRKYIENYRKDAFGNEKVFVNHVETHPTGIVNKHEVDYTKPIEVANIDNNFIIFSYCVNPFSLII